MSGFKRRLMFCLYLLATWQAASWGYLRGLSQLQSGQQPDIWPLSIDVPYLSVDTLWLTSGRFAWIALAVGFVPLAAFIWVSRHSHRPLTSQQRTANLVGLWLSLTALIAALCYALPAVVTNELDNQFIGNWLRGRLSQPPDWLSIVSRLEWYLILAGYFLTLLVNEMTGRHSSQSH